MHHPRTRWPVETRVSYIVAFEGARHRFPRLSARRFCQVADLPYATFARWWAAYRRRGPSGLKNRSCRPRHSPRALSGAVLDIVRLAHRETGLGARRLHAALTRAGRIRCSPSSVYRLLRRAGALLCRPRRPKPTWIRYAKTFPGERAQADLKYLPEGRFQFTIVDDCSRMVAATVLTRRTMAAVCGATERLLEAFPFPIRCLQTDNGSEFGQQLTRLLAHRGIRHAHIRPRTPRLNGKVERVQRTMQEELWDGVAPGPVEAWIHELEGYLRFYNRERLHSALGYRPPLEYAQQRLLRQARISQTS